MYICTQDNSSPILLKLYKKKVIHLNLQFFIHLYHYICPALIKSILLMIYSPPLLIHPQLFPQKLLFILPPYFHILSFELCWIDNINVSYENINVQIQQKNETKKNLNLISLNDFLDLVLDELILNS